MSLGRITALVFSMIFGVITLAAGTLLMLGGVWGGLLLWIPGGALVALAMRLNDRVPEAEAATYPGPQEPAFDPSVDDPEGQ